MYPVFEPFSGFIIYSFGITLTICFFSFIWMIKKLSERFGYNSYFFIKDIVWYFLSIFIFSRLFYIISQFNNLMYIKDAYGFFIMSDYNFSLVGAVIGFLIVFIINLKLKKEKFIKYVDGLSISFIFILSIGFIGALLGGQVYGIETNLGIEITYKHPFSPISNGIEIFPLAIIYSISFFIIFSTLYILSMFIHIKGLIGYMGLISVSCIFLIFDFFSGKHDILKNFLGLTFTQFFSIILIGFCVKQLYLIFKENDENSFKKFILNAFKK
ncbi:hypothetical protein CSB08_00915 [Candidatus Gracilibacteria bacterium]|nr:MAG: hypothetical protein CSB08_00915 [Candidatus Gracilibacteria bacterium]PIE85713.1 MAG: hypothetical protein CSA08_00345 [Candidatus Gracilibacteria bacterium]